MRPHQNKNNSSMGRRKRGSIGRSYKAGTGDVKKRKRSTPVLENQQLPVLPNPPSHTQIMF
jgi:hypothetical protein